VFSVPPVAKIKKIILGALGDLGGEILFTQTPGIEALSLTEKKEQTFPEKRPKT